MTDTKRLQVNETGEPIEDAAGPYVRVEDYRAIVNLAYRMADDLGAMTKPHELCNYGMCETEEEARVEIDRINQALKDVRHV